MSRKGYPSDKQDQFVLRLPKGMRDRIRVAAEANNRSMNAEIVAALEEKYPAPGPVTFAGLVEILSALKDLGPVPDPAQRAEYEAGLAAVIEMFIERYPSAAPAALAEMGYDTEGRRSKP